MLWRPRYQCCILRKVRMQDAIASTQPRALPRMSKRFESYHDAIFRMIMLPVSAKRKLNFSNFRFGVSAVAV